MPLTDSLRDDILASVPSLRAFAISLSGNGDRADDLVQETLLRAIANIDSFQPGSNLPAWLFTILRNLFRSDYRKRRREVEDAEGNYAKTLKTQPSQGAHLEFEEFRAALDELPQETLLRAIANIDSFQPGSNLPAWLFTILRNLFRSDYRKRRREVEDAEGNYAKTLKTQPSQGAHLEFEEFRAALDKLPQDQREALILVGASGFSYEDAATICGCAVGTIKSRVNRARSKLSALLYVDGAEDFGPDNTVRAVIGGNGGGHRVHPMKKAAPGRRPFCWERVWIQCRAASAEISHRSR